MCKLSWENAQRKTFQCKTIRRKCLNTIEGMQIYRVNFKKISRKTQEKEKCFKEEKNREFKKVQII